jgi:hypothetical protein
VLSQLSYTPTGTANPINITCFQNDWTGTLEWLLMKEISLRDQLGKMEKDWDRRAR